MTDLQVLALLGQDPSLEMIAEVIGDLLVQHGYPDTAAVLRKAMDDYTQDAADDGDW